MKLVLATDANGRFFDLLDELSGVRVVRAYDEETLRRELVDADAVYGWPSAAALAEALAERWIAWAALDATEREPLPADSPLWGSRTA